MLLIASAVICMAGKGKGIARGLSSLVARRGAAAASHWQLPWARQPAGMYSQAVLGCPHGSVATAALYWCSALTAAPRQCLAMRKTRP
jgi:hypothetical protein